MSEKKSQARSEKSQARSEKSSVKAAVAVRDIEISYLEYSLENKELAECIRLIKKHSNIENPMDLLPKSRCAVVSFVLENAYSELANALRRCLLAEIRVRCMNFNSGDFVSDDDFILPDALVKNIHMIPIHQNAVIKDKQTLYLFFKNTSPHAVDVYASEFMLADGSGSKVKDLDINEIIAETNIPFVKLLPDKVIQIKKCEIIEGYAFQDAAKFSLLNNVSYKILDVKPYDPFEGTGEKSVVSNPTKFCISYTTKGNIEPNEVMLKCCDSLIERLENLEKILQTYIDATKDNNENKRDYYNSDRFEVIKNGNFYIYKCDGFYITLGSIIAKKCFLLDPNISSVSSTVERLDTEKMILKINHTTPDLLFRDAIAGCLVDLKKIKSYF